MGVMDLVRRRLAPIILRPQVASVGPSWDEWWGEITTDIRHGTPARLFRSQPHLYTVVSFLARNVAQLGLHCFERVSETDRRRDRTSAAARALSSPDGIMTTYELIYALVGDLMLYDRAYWFVGESSERPSGWMIRRLPPSWVGIAEGDAFSASKYVVAAQADVTEVDASQILAFGGYSPTSPLHGSPAVEALRGTLIEQVEAAEYRAQVWKRGGRASSVLERPKDAPAWSDTARASFAEDWYAKFTGRGQRAGGTPILEDGMTLKRVDFNAQEQQFVEAAKLSLQTVASAFHVNPTMIGQNDGANYSNVREFRRMLYGDTLGPLLAQIESRINAFLLPSLGVDPERFYVEFNIGEKLQGSFEEQAAAMQSATGAPWMTRAEARARMNLPAIPGADDLVVPLNVLTGGQASPRDSGSQNRNGRTALAKAAPSDPVRERASKLVRDFFVRQERVVRSALGSKAATDWWDETRWDSELADDLYRLAALVADEIGQATAKSLGFSIDDYDTDRTRAFLKAVADRRAKAINTSTRQAIEDALGSDDPESALDSAWTVAKDQRSGALGFALAATLAGFATTEAGRQVAGDHASKTWVTGPNARPAHARMNGETVGLDEPFSNGGMWPGDFDLGPDENSGCNCSVTITT